MCIRDRLSPDTYPHNTLDHAGYDYSKLQIQGFSHTRIEGVGGQGAGCLLYTSI